MPHEETSVFQRVLEALERARDAGEDTLRRDQRDRQEDDLDCYPRGVQVLLPKTHEAWNVIRFLAKNLNWVSLEPRRLLNLRPRLPMDLRVSEVCYLRALCESLRRDGIECIPEVHYR